MDNKLGNKHTMAANIKYYMDLYGKTRKEMCEILNVPYTTFTSWIKEQNYPRIDKIEKMAQVFKITKADLVEERATNKNEKVETSTSRPRKKGVKIPVLGEVIAGVPIEAIEDILDYEEISEDMAAKGEHFALKVKGDSMEPVFYAGDIVIVRQQPTADSGDIVIALVNGDESTIKKLKLTDDGLMLIPANPAYEPMYYTRKQIDTLPVSIIGKVVELRRSF